MNKKKMLRRISEAVLGLFFVIILAVCAAAPEVQNAAAPLPPSGTVQATRAITLTVNEIDRFGNITLNVPAAGVMSAGFALGDMVRLELGSFNGIVPIVSTYSEVDHGYPLVRFHATANVTMVAVNMGNFSELYSIEAGMYARISLVERGGYLAELEIRTLERSYVREDYPSDVIFANFREARLGGIGANVIYRSTHPALNAGEMASRSPYSQRLAEAAGIATVINLADHPHELSERAANVPWYQGFINRGSIIALGMGIDYRNPDFAGQLKTGIEFMLENRPPFLIHCNEGKDRAGVTVALFGALMGATPDEIINDYMLSYINFYWVNPGEERYDLIAGIMRGILTDFNGGTMPGPGQTTAAAERYLSQVVELSTAQINALKQLLSGN